MKAEPVDIDDMDMPDAPTPAARLGIVASSDKTNKAQNCVQLFTMPSKSGKFQQPILLHGFHLSVFSKTTEWNSSELGRWCLGMFTCAVVTYLPTFGRLNPESSRT